MENTKQIERKALVQEALRMAWPAVLESFFVSLAGMIDTMMVSSLGTSAVSSVGLTIQPKFVALSIFFSCNVTVSALVARRRGQNNRRNANEVLSTALLFTIVCCVLLSIVSIVFADPIIDFCGSNADTHAGAVEYFNIIQGCMIFNVLSLVINAAQRGSGNTKIAMTTNILSSIVNIVFNYLLIGGNFGFPKWGLFGAAFATVLGTVAACILSFRSLFRKNSYVSIPYMIQEKIRPSWNTMKSILSLSLNIFLENIAMRIGFMYTSVIAAKLGTDAFAAHQVGMNFLSMGFSFGDGMQVAAVALIGRSLGEKKPDIAKAYGRICQMIGLMMSVVLAAIMVFFGRDLFSLFFTETTVLNLGVMVCNFISVILVFQISQIIFGGCLRGAGDVKYTLFASLLSVTIIRTAVTWLLTSIWPLGLVGIWIGVLADQASRLVLLGLRFRQGKWVQIEV